MKKAFSAFCVMILSALFFSVVGQAETTRYIQPLQTREHRVKLRSRPSRQADVLGQYYTNTEVTVLSVSGDWAKVSIGGREGYMMKNYLRDHPDDGFYAHGFPGKVIEGLYDETVMAYEKPDTSSMVSIFFM